MTARAAQNYIALPGNMLQIMAESTYIKRGKPVAVPHWVWRLYIHLCGKANRAGESWWSAKRTAAALDWTENQLKGARRILLAAQFEGRRLLDSYRVAEIRTWVTVVVDRIREQHTGIHCATCNDRSARRRTDGTIECSTCGTLYERARDRGPRPKSGRQAGPVGGDEPIHACPTSCGRCGGSFKPDRNGIVWCTDCGSMGAMPKPGTAAAEAMDVARRAHQAAEEARAIAALPELPPADLVASEPPPVSVLGGEMAPPTGGEIDPPSRARVPLNEFAPENPPRAREDAAPAFGGFSAAGTSPALGNSCSTGAASGADKSGSARLAARDRVPWSDGAPTSAHQAPAGGDSDPLHRAGFESCRAARVRLWEWLGWDRGWTAIGLVPRGSCIDSAANLSAIVILAPSKRDRLKAEAFTAADGGASVRVAMFQRTGLASAGASVVVIDPSDAATLAGLLPPGFKLEPTAWAEGSIDG